MPNSFEEIDDSTFLNAPRSGYSLEPSSSNSYLRETFQNEHKQILDQRSRIEQATLQSTKNSLALIYETEKVGVATAEELLHQREQLNNIDGKLDNINSVMRISQKHLTSMKSIFGGFRNYFNKDKSKTDMPKKLSHSATDSKLSTTVHSIRNQTESIDNQMNHPSLRNKASIYDESTPHSSYSNDNLSAYEKQSREVDKELDGNLKEIGAGIGRLKELALGLGQEIDSQNVLIDSISSKNEKAQDNIEHQNRQMKKILKS